ncbi:hypothetical protein [Pedobacter frigoris]|uniref:Uncharacterized protein n=1 Tax=Pedobacter frigoris TaxID=2571272 RepID=A0A4V5NZH5_9SPHI|nr:hypothetical protein [Pedobacter frigoris]TKC06958.1 hypothetical protein FA047_06715 [Pedobacter frigoris]
MNKINMKALLCVVLLLGTTLLVNSCKRGLEIKDQPQVVLNEAILKAKAHVESILQEQGSDSFVKTMGFEMNWEKAIVDSANHIRVPIYFDLSKLKPKDSKQTAPAKTKDVFELYIKNVRGQTEVSIMQFMSIGGKYYPMRYTLAGQLKTKLKASVFKRDVLSIGGNGDKILSSVFNKKMITESGVMELIQMTYGSNYLAAVIYECPLGTLFDPVACLCDFPENVSSGAIYPELFMMIITASSTYQIVPYTYSFHPSEITDDDPEYPDGPVNNQVGDCAGVTGGNAYNTCCGCIGGSTGISDCSEFSDSPTLTPTASIAEVSPSAAAITMLGGDWGLALDESIDLEIGASLSDCVWKAVLKSAKGNYSVQARLVAGCSEVGGTNSYNYCAQVTDLKALGNAAGLWYMVSAVRAHENVHVTRILPSLNYVLSTIQANVKTLTVPAIGQTKAQAIAQLMSLAAFQAVKNDAETIWRDEYWGTVEADHLGSCLTAEHNIVDPVGIVICNNASTYTPAWPACTSCPY